MLRPRGEVFQLSQGTYDSLNFYDTGNIINSSCSSLLQYSDLFLSTILRTGSKDSSWDSTSLHITEYTMPYIQAGLLTVQVAQCTPRGAVHHPAGTGWVQGCTQALHRSPP
jgi:hypothetical protein